MIEFPLLPLLHENIEPIIELFAFKITVSPVHISLLVTVKLRLGKGFTVMDIDAVVEHPEAVVPVTLYVVVVVGLTVIVELVDPLLHK